MGPFCVPIHIEKKIQDEDSFCGFGSHLEGDVMFSIDLKYTYF